MHSNSVFAPVREVTRLDDCFFYHTMEIPGFGEVRGAFDLRNGVREYLGGVAFGGKRVLELGAATGFLSAYMEKQGAEVVGYDLSAEYAGDLVPFADGNLSEEIKEAKEIVRKINNGYWLNHRASKLKAKMVYGSIYGVPEEIGVVDIATFGDILLHLRDPFLALQNALRLTKETVIVTEPLWRWGFLHRMIDLLILSRIPIPIMMFAPRILSEKRNNFTWWFLPPAIVKQFIAVLGFTKAEVHFHSQKADMFGGRSIPHYTVVGHRTHGIPVRK